MKLHLHPVLFKDFCRFARAQVITGDIDPAYPVLKRFYAEERLTREEALWRTFLYVTLYHLGSAVLAWERYPKPVYVTDLRLSTGIERRGFRGNNKAAEHVNAFLRVHVEPSGSIGAWVDHHAYAGEQGWSKLSASYQERVPGAGPWAAYKLCDLLAHVHDVPITAPDIGHKLGETAGPVPGMVRLTGESWQVCAGTVQLQRDLLEASRAAGVPFTGLDQLETALCDFNSLCKGGYYLGHDIDAQLEALKDARSPGLWGARAVFHPSYRGESPPTLWTRVRKELKTAYRDLGQLANMPPASFVPVGA